MSPEGWTLYTKALDLWQKKEYEKAENTLSILSLSDRIYTKVILLYAYILRDTGKYITEISILTDSIQIFAEKSPLLLSDLYSLLGEAYNIIGNAHEAVNNFLLSCQHDFKYNQFSKAIESYNNAIFASAGIADFSVDEAECLYSGYRDLLEYNFSPMPSVKYYHKKIRIGYLSADFRHHPVGYLLYPLISNYSQNKFEVYCYSVGSVHDDINSAFKECSAEWRDVSNLDYIQLAEQIRADEIDILVDCGGHTCNNRLAVFALRPAPVQISAIGWVGSTGLYDTDYILTDNYCAPFETNPFYTEKFLTISGSHFCFSYLRGKYPEITESPFRRNGYITFGCFNNFAKITDKMLENWSIILNKVPNSKLILKHKLLGYEEGQQLAKARLLKAGISIDRVELRGFSSDYLQQYNDIDIALDTFPYTGGMTTFDSLYMGVPVISLVGKRHGERFGFSLLSNAGLDMLTADNEDEYIAKARALAENGDILSKLHEKLRDVVEKSPLMDDVGYVASVEKIYEDIVGRD